MLNTPTHRGSSTDEARIRRETVIHGIPCITTIAAAAAAAQGIHAMIETGLGVRALQDYYTKDDG